MSTPWRQLRAKPVVDSMPAAGRALNVRRRGLLIVVAIVVLVVATLLTVVMWSSAQWKRAEGELYVTLDTLCAVVDDRDQDFAEVRESVGNAIRDRTYFDQPLTRSALDVLKNGKAFFERYVERDFGEWRAVLARPVAYEVLGEINETLGFIAQAEAAYRDSQRLLQHLCDQSPDHQPRFLLAVTNNSLGCLLATTGRPAEAERPAAEAVAGLEKLLEEDPGNSSARVELSYASRNLGLILAVLGRDGTEYARRSIAQTKRFAAEFPTKITVGEFLIDSHQILAQLLWRQERFSQAEDACRQSSEEIDSLLKRFQALADQDGRVLPTFRYRKAVALARASIARFQQTREGARPSANSWQWNPLHQLPGRLLQTNLLVRGSLPGEFERQDAFLMVWLDEAWCDQTVVKMVVEIYEHARVIILVKDELIEEEVRQTMQAAGVAPDRLKFCHVSTNTLWVRDYGPIVIDTGDGTYQSVAPRHVLDVDTLNDAHASLALSKTLGFTVVPAPFFMEGGEVLSNGEGLCLVSAGLLKINCQVGYPESHVTETIKRLFGATHVIYLESLQDEPTGHVDLFTTFTSPDTIVIGEYEETEDSVNAKLLDRHAVQLARVTTANGPLQVERIPMPPRREQQFGGSYTNVVFANGTLLVPTYAQAPPEVEREVFELYQRLLPGWRTVGIDCSKLITRQGALHCAVANLHRLPQPQSALVAGEPAPVVRPVENQGGSGGSSFPSSAALRETVPIAAMRHAFHATAP